MKLEPLRIRCVFIVFSYCEHCYYSVLAMFFVFIVVGLVVGVVRVVSCSCDPYS